MNIVTNYRDGCGRIASVSHAPGSVSSVLTVTDKHGVVILHRRYSTGKTARVAMRRVMDNPVKLESPGMKYVVVFVDRLSGARFTCDAFPCNGQTAEQSLVECINYQASAGCRLVSVSTAPLDGDEVPFDPDI